MLTNPSAARWCGRCREANGFIDFASNICALCSAEIDGETRMAFYKGEPLHGDDPTRWPRK